MVKIKTKKNNIVILDQFKDGKKGTAKLDKLDAGYENFKIGAFLEHPLLNTPS